MYVWRRSRMLSCILIMLSCALLMGAATLGCAKKKTRSVTFEGPESEVSLELETTDKNPDDE